MVENLLRLRIEIDSLAGPIRLCRHHASYGMRKSILHGGVRLFACAQTLEPIRHVRKIVIADAYRWQARVSRQQNIFSDALPIDLGVILMIAISLDHLPPRATFPTSVVHRGFL